MLAPIHIFLPTQLEAALRRYGERAPLLDVGHDGASDFHWHLHRSSIGGAGKNHYNYCLTAINRSLDGIQHIDSRLAHMHKVMHARMNGPVALEPSSNISCPPCGWWPRAGPVATSGSGGDFASLVAMVFAFAAQLVQWPLPAFLFPLLHRRWTAALVHQLEVGLRVKIHGGHPTLLHELAPLVAHLRQAKEFLYLSSVTKAGTHHDPMFSVSVCDCLHDCPVKEALGARVAVSCCNEVQIGCGMALIEKPLAQQRY